jgi:hypothetical protein
MPALSQSDVVLLIVVALAIGLVCIYGLRRGSGYADLVEHSPDTSPGLHLGEPRTYQPPTREHRDAADVAFMDNFYGGLWNFVDRYFHVRIAGGKYRNDDGTSRSEFIRQCKPLELLVIQWDKCNRHDRYAKIVRRQNGQQLGFLQSHVAEEIHDDFSIPGVTWFAIFKQARHHPETGQVVGATILLARKTPERVAKADATIAEALRNEGRL